MGRSGGKLEETA